MPKKSDPSSADQPVEFRVLLSVAMLARELYSTDARQGLEARAFQVLLAIAVLGEPSVAEIGDELKLPYRKVVDQLRRLRALGLSASRPDADDGRRHLQSVTPAGRAVLDEFAAASGPALARLRDVEYIQATGRGRRVATDAATLSLVCAFCRRPLE
jgi:DNA-binding MarR family transcriptional regulator